MEKSILNSKVSIIDENGQIYLIGRVNEKNSHVKCMLAYANYKYPGIVIDKLYEGNSRDRIALALGQFGDIIYLNDNNFGVFYFPNNINSKQLETLFNLNLGKQKVGIFYDLKDIGKNVFSKTIGDSFDYNLQEAISEFLDEKKTKRK